MSAHWIEARRAAREQQDYRALVALIPYARFLGMEAATHEGRLQLRLPFRDSLVGNPRRRAWHGGVTAAFMENTALLQLLLQLDENRMPKRSEEHTSELQSLMRISYAVFCLKKKKHNTIEE